MTTDTRSDFAPLTGVRVVSIALNVPGPMAAERLRSFGAAVTKVEPPEGDPLRRSSIDFYTELTRGMTVETCDLKSPDGRARFDRLLAQTDLLLTSQRPAALARLQVGWNELHERFPKLCQVAIVGHAAPDQNVAGHDLTYLAVNGLVQPPALPRTLFADVAGSEAAALAALGCILERGRTGTGCYREVALADAAARLAAPRRAGLTLAGKIVGGGFPGYQLYRTKNGWVAVAALEAHFYKRLCEGLKIATPSYEQFAERFAAEDNDHWVRFAREHDVPIEPLEDGR